MATKPKSKSISTRPNSNGATPTSVEVLIGKTNTDFSLGPTPAPARLFVSATPAPTKRPKYPPEVAMPDHPPEWKSRTIVKQSRQSLPAVKVIKYVCLTHGVHGKPLVAFHYSVGEHKAFASITPASLRRIKRVLHELNWDMSVYFNVRRTDIYFWRPDGWPTGPAWTIRPVEIRWDHGNE